MTTAPEKRWHIAAVGLGSNLGDRTAAIKSAVSALDALEGVVVLAMSSIIETEPVGGPPQDRYHNGAVLLGTTLSPRSLLEHCLAIEAAAGRSREGLVRWGPRTIDLDLLLYDRQIIDEPGLKVPHPRMTERRFVLEPLSEIAGSLIEPRSGVTIECLLQRCPAASA